MGFFDAGKTRYILNTRTNEFGQIAFEIGRSIVRQSLNPMLENQFNQIRDIINQEFNAIEDYLNGISSQHENATKGCVSYAAIKLGYENESIEDLDIIRDQAQELHNIMKDQRVSFITNHTIFMTDVRKKLDILYAQNMLLNI